MLDSKGHTKLVDFGFAKQLSKNGKALTNCGTPDYVAPEVVKNIGAGFEADIWSFGVLICEVISG